jgi:hypothetical protein
MRPKITWLWILPGFAALAGFLVGCFRGDGELIGRSTMVFACSLSVARLAGGLDLFF